MRSLRRCPSILLSVFACAFTLSAQSSSSFEGKWVFNAKESIFSPGPLPKSETITFADGVTTIEGVDAQGQTFKWSFMPKPGKAVPVNGGQDLTVETKESGDTLVHMWSDHSDTSYGCGQISADASSMRYVLIGTRGGKHVYEVSVFDKQ